MILSINTKGIKNFKSNLKFWVFWGLIDALVVCNYSNGDYEGYKIMYYNSSFNSYWLEPGYCLLEKIFSYIGVDFFAFRGLIVTISLFLIAIAIQHFSESPTFTLLLYCVYPMILDSVQLRNFLSSAICIFALIFLEKKNKRGIIYFVTLVVVATTIHTVAITFLLLLVTLIVKEEMLKKICITFFIMSSAIMLVFRKQLAGIIQIIFLKLYKNIVFTYDNVISWLIMAALFEIYIGYLSSKSKTNKFIFSCAYMSCIIMPLMIFRFDFYRVYRNFLVVNYMALSSKHVKGTLSKGNIVLTVLVIILFTIQLSPRNGGNFEIATFPFIHDNYFMDWFGL